MKHLHNRIDLMVKLGEYFKNPNDEWLETIDNAQRANGWFVKEFIDIALENITNQFLNKEKLIAWTRNYSGIDKIEEAPKNVGIVMAGNIPLVGFHDFLAVFISGHHQTIKLSSKDTILWNHIIAVLGSWDPSFNEAVKVTVMLKGCDAYIATGSNNSARYFESYFEKYPSIIRKNRTSVAILSGQETAEDLAYLTEDISLYFGMGCRNITKIFVPEGYDFIPLINALKKYEYLVDHNKFKNNYDFQLAMYLLNRAQYMTDGHILLIENENNFTALSVLNYEYYTDINNIIKKVENNIEIQCVTTNLEVKNSVKIGQNQVPSLTDYADGIDVMEFLLSL